jgi:hypothetical protein
MGKSKDLATLATTLNNGVNLQPNLITNGDMSVDQRNSGSSVTVSHATDTFCPDRFRFTENHSGTFTIQQVEDAPDDLEYSSKITVTGTDTSLGAGEFARILQGIEGKNVSHLNWGSSNAKTCTLTFYVKSSVTGAYYISLFNSAANRSFVSGYTINTADTWEKKTITITGDTSGTWLTTNSAGIYISWSLGTGTTYQTSTLNRWAGAFDMVGSDQINLAATSGATWQLTGVSFVLGDTAPVTHPYESYDENLARCQRYLYQVEGSLYDHIATGYRNNTNQFWFPLHLPCAMRAKPTYTATNVGIWYGTGGSWSTSISGVALYGTAAQDPFIIAPTSFTGISTSITEGIAGFANNGLLRLEAEL